MFKYSGYLIVKFALFFYFFENEGQWRVVIDTEGKVAAKKRDLKKKKFFFSLGNTIGLAELMGRKRFDVLC